jgi:hypothetical protein
MSRGVIPSSSSKHYFNCWIDALFLFGMILPSTESVNSTYPKPVFQWKAQSLSRCLTYGGPLQYSTCIQQAASAEVSRPAGDQRACFNDPAKLFQCPSPGNPGCQCTSASNVFACEPIKVDGQRGFGPGCMETIFAVEGRSSTFFFPLGC